MRTLNYCNESDEKVIVFQDMGGKTTYGTFKGTILRSQLIILLKQKVSMLIELMIKALLNFF